MVVEWYNHEIIHRHKILTVRYRFVRTVITYNYLADDQGNEYYNPPPSKKRQRETREDEGGPGYVKAKGTWYRARKCHKVNSNEVHYRWAYGNG